MSSSSINGHSYSITGSAYGSAHPCKHDELSIEEVADNRANCIKGWKCMDCGFVMNGSYEEYKRRNQQQGVRPGANAHQHKEHN